MNEAILNACRAIVAGLAAGKSSMDDDMLQHLITLGDNAVEILAEDARRENAARYDVAMDELGISPNGDDYNALLDLLAGHDYVAPKTTGR